MSNFEAEQKAKAAWSRLEEDSHGCGRSELERRIDRDLLQRWRSAKSELDQVLKNRGARYEQCTFDNYECSNGDQKNAVDALKSYAANATDNLKNGKNVLLFGPRGSGKDHLLIALAKSVFSQTGEAIYWENGCDWFEHIRQSALNQSTRPQQVSKYWKIQKGYQAREEKIEAECPIFCLSDPLPLTGSLSEFQQLSLFRIIDSRYSNLKPTWMSLNVVDGSEAEQRMGAQTVDRLKDGALVLFCNWASHRKAGMNL